MKYRVLETRVNTNWARMLRRGAALVMFGLWLVVCLVAGARSASASTLELRPNVDPTGLTGNANTSWLGTPSGAQYNILNRSSYNESQYLCGLSGNWGFRYGMSDVASVGQGATSIELVVSSKMRRPSLITTPDDQIVIGGYLHGTTGLGPWSYQQSGWADSIGSTCSMTFTNSSENTRSATFTPSSGVWTAADINSLEMYIGRQTIGSANPIKVFLARAIVTYDANPVIVSYVGKVFADSNSATPGAAISPDYVYADHQDVLTSNAQKFRLRLTALNLSGDSWKAGYGSLNLQYAKRTGSSCTAQLAGWTNVGPATPGVRFYDNPSIADGTHIDLGLGDDSGIVMQSYKESNPVATRKDLTPAAPITGWDFSLQADPSSYGESFCFKLSPNSPLELYTDSILLVDVKTAPMPFGFDIVDSSGVSVASPSVGFGLLTASTQCQQSTATMGTTNQRLRLFNGTATNGWSVSIAPAAGPAAGWATADLAHRYDHNDPTAAGCLDGGDSDSWGGQLSLNPATATVAPSSGCGLTGVTKGTAAAFTEGGTSAITLLSGSSSAPLNCYWDMTGISLTQKVPAATPVGTYSLDLVATAVAL